MNEEHIVVGYDQEVYKRTYKHEDEIIDSLEEGFVSAVMRLIDGKLEYATIKWDVAIDEDLEIVWKEPL